MRLEGMGMGPRLREDTGGGRGGWIPAPVFTRPGSSREQRVGWAQARQRGWGGRVQNDMFGMTCSMLGQKGEKRGPRMRDGQRVVGPGRNDMWGRRRWVPAFARTWGLWRDPGTTVEIPGVGGKGWVPAFARTWGHVGDPYDDEILHSASLRSE